MAIFLGSSNFNGYNGSHFTMSLYIESYTQNVEENSTTATFYVDFSSKDGYSGSGAGIPVDIGGQVVNYVSSIGRNQTIRAGQRTMTVWHSPDGTFNWQIYANMNSTWGGLGNSNVTVWWTPPTIPRASAIANKTVVIGTKTSISWTRASSNFKHTLKYKFGDIEEVIGSNLDTSVEWTPKDEMYQYLVSKQGTGILELQTFNNGSYIGSKKSTLTVDANIDVASPLVDDLNYKDVNQDTINITKDDSYVVSNYSSIQVDDEFSTRKYATLKKAFINDVDVTQFVVLQEQGEISKYKLQCTLSNFIQNEIILTVVDSRDIEAINNKHLGDKFIEYTPISASVQIKRTQPTTGAVDSIFSGNYFNNKFNQTDNELTIKFRYKKSNEEDYSDDIILQNNVDYQIVEDFILSGVDQSEEKKAQNIDLGSVYDYRYNYDFEFTFVDLLSSQKISLSIIKGIPIVNWNGNKFNVNGDLYVSDENGENPINVLEKINFKPKKSVDSNGWVCIDFGTYKKYFKTGSFTTTFQASGWGGALDIPLPSDVSKFNSSIMDVNINARCADAAVGLDGGINNNSTFIRLHYRNNHSGNITNVSIYNATLTHYIDFEEV